MLFTLIRKMFRDAALAGIGDAVSEVTGEHPPPDTAPSVDWLRNHLQPPPALPAANVKPEKVKAGK